MKKSVWKIFLALVFVTVAFSGCAPAPTPIPPTFMPSPIPSTFTSEPTATSTAIPSPTSTSTPTASPTPVPEMGKPISSENWEVIVIGAVIRKRISTAYTTSTYFTPKKGSIFIDVGLKVKNLNPTTNPSALASHAIIIDEKGESWHPFLWGDQTAVSGKEIDPFSVGIYYSVSSEDIINIEGESYLRFIFAVSDTSLGKIITFRFQDAPVVPFTINK